MSELDARVAELKNELIRPGANIAEVKAQLTRLLVPAKETAAFVRTGEVA